MSNFNLPYIVGTTLRRDHQYWPTVTPAEFATFGLPTTRPTGVDLDTILAFAWRVKRWEVTGSYEITLPYTSVSPPYSGTATYTFDFPDADSTPAAPVSVPMRNKNPFTAADVVSDKELDIISTAELTDTLLSEEFKFHGLMNYGHANFLLNSIVSVGFTADPNFFDPPSDPFNAVMSTYWNDLLFAYTFIGGLVKRSQFQPFESDTFYPYADNHGTIPSVRAGVAGKVGTIQFQVSDVDSNGTLTIDPVVFAPVEFPMRIDGSLDANVINPDPAGVGSCDVTLTAVEFWPFKNSLGEDVYDTTTGAQINDPFA